MAEHSHVDHQGLMTAVLDLAGQESNFLSLGIEGAEYDDRRHVPQSPMIATARTGAAVVLTHLTGNTASLKPEPGNWSRFVMFSRW